jgi:hypothetical protein
MSGRKRGTRIHDCRFAVPLVSEFTKLPSEAECQDPDCYWGETAREVTPEALRDLRALAIHHAKARRHEVLLRLRQEVRLRPRDDDSGRACAQCAPGYGHNNATYAPGSLLHDGPWVNWLWRRSRNTGREH